MQGFDGYNYTIKEKDLISTIKKVKEHGYDALLMINGEYYNIQLEEESKER